MDDILIYSDNQKKHTEQTERVLQWWLEKQLYLKLDKCSFNQSEVEFLGMIIKHGHVMMDPVKIKGIKEWPVPTKVKGVRAFLGFGNFYQKFIDGFATISQPLNELTRKNVPFEWTTACQKAFDTLKSRFTTAPVLQLVDRTKPFQIESNASKFATGAVLRQKDTNRDWHPVAYLSKSFN